MNTNDLLQSGWIWDPWRHLRTLQGEVEQAFGQPRYGGGAPAVNVWRNEDALLLRTELPGIDPESLDVAVLGDNVTLRCEKPENSFGADEKVTVHRHERTSGIFERTLQLPFRVEADDVEARFEHGILELKLPRAAEDKPRRIEVKAV